MRDPSQRMNCPLSGDKCGTDFRLLIIYSGSTNLTLCSQHIRAVIGASCDALLFLLAMGREAVIHRAHPPEKGTGSASWGLRKKVPVNLLPTPRKSLDLLPPQHTHPEEDSCLHNCLTSHCGNVGHFWQCVCECKKSSLWGCNKGNPLTFFSRVLLGASCMWCSLLEGRFVVDGGSLTLQVHCV